MKSSVQWLDRNAAWPLPHFCLCTSEAEFESVLKHIKALPADRPASWLSAGAPATMHTFERNGHPKVCVVCINVPKGKLKGEVYGLIIHEAVHVWQEYLRGIGERNPSPEFEAYSLQAICQRLLWAYDGTHMDKRA